MPHQVEMVSSGPLAVFCTLPYFVMAFSCQQNAFNAIGELRTPTKARQLLVVSCVPILPMVLCKPTVILTVASSSYNVICC